MATSDKYDRQLRLWGANGQRALSMSRIVLIHASAAGTETVKNLVLPGIGSFHIIDEEFQRCSSSDVSFPSNFFAIPHGHKGWDTTKLCRANIVCDLLSELNEEVQGSWQTVPSLLDADFSTLLADQQQNPACHGLLVIAADLPLQILSKLSNICWCQSIPLVSVKAYGFVGTLRIQTPYHTIVESKPDSSPPDLRLTSVTNPHDTGGCSFPELKSFVDSIDLSSFDDMALQHVPYVVILVKAMELWKEQYKKTTVPQTLQDKDSFKTMIKSMSKDYHMQVNFQEAHRDAYLAYTDRPLPDEVETILNSTTIDSIKTNFDIMVFALKCFMEAHGGRTPLNGSIPDMTSSTELYVQLQQVYKNRANDDLGKMRELVESTIRSLVNKNQVSSPLEISEEELAIFCKNIYNIQTIKMGRLDMEIQRCRSGSDDSNLSYKFDRVYEDDVKESLAVACMDPSDPPQHMPLLWYLVVRACEMFQVDHHLYPGGDSRSLSLQADTEEVWRNLRCIITNLGLQDVEIIQDHLTKDHAAQAVSWYNAEIHNVASIIGGVASQEAVKLITHQYVPLDNTYVFNGIASMAAVYKL
jgi:amyloid beta precursor protein binding protein 1